MKFYKENKNITSTFKKSFPDCFFFVSQKISLRKSKIKLLVLVFCLIIIFSFGSNIALGMIGGGDGIAKIAGNKVPQSEPSCSFFSTPLKCLLLPLFSFAGMLLSMSGTLFIWIIDTRNISLVLTSPELFKIWAYVRDLLNMSFIMVLLFSAFCTIFQVEQYNYKKMLWKIVLMALLVNFSFPITRFIIDASNILMYSIIQSSFFSDTNVYSSLGSIAKNSSLTTLMNSETFPNASSLLGATAMIFMLAITFLAIGVLLLIRIIALAILIIFSPVAFAGSIIPGVSAQASKWWDNLFKYSFFGPIMILGVAIAVQLMNGVGKALSEKALEAAGKQSIDATYIGSLTFILVPIVLLWIVMGVAQSMSIAGAGAVMGQAQKAMKWSAKAPGRAAWWGIKKGGIPGGVKQKWTKFKKSGLLGSDATERREAKYAEKGPYSVEGAINEHARKKANEKLDEWKKIGPPSTDELRKLQDSPDDIIARAASLQLAESVGFDGKYDDYKKAIERLGTDRSAIDILNEKTKKKGRDLILAHKINQPLDKDGKPNTLKLQDELAKLDNADFGSINFKNLVTNTSNAGARGGVGAVQEFFKDAGSDRTTQISRRINKENMAYLGDSFFATRKQGGPKTREDAEKVWEKINKKSV